MLLAWAARHGVLLQELRAETASLERAFLALTNATDLAHDDHSIEEHAA